MNYFRSDFADHFKGLFKLESSSTFIQSEFSEMEASRYLLTREFEKPLEPQFTEVPPMNAASIGSVLTWIHEQDHYKVLLSTPVGLLLWRIEQCLAVDVYYLRRKFPEIEQGSFPSLFDAIHHEINFGPSSRMERQDEVELTSRGAFNLRNFLCVMLLRTEVTVSQFIKIADFAFGYLAHRSGLRMPKANWATGLDHDRKLLTADQPTLLEIIEASARARELLNMNRHRVSQETISQWWEASIFGVYAPAFDFLMSELGDASWCKIAIDLALASPIDPCLSSEGPLAIETLLPSYRLAPICQSIKDRVWDVGKDGGMGEFLYDGMLVGLGFPSASEMYRKLSGMDLSVNARWGGSIEASAENIADEGLEDLQEAEEFFNKYFGSEEHLKYLESRYRANFSERTRDPLYFVTFQAEGYFESLLTFFSDRMIVSASCDREDLVFAAFNHLMDREISREYIYGIEADDLQRYEKLFKEWYLQQGGQSDFIDEVFRINGKRRREPSGAFSLNDIAPR